jgi:CBS domain-containing protein
MKNQTLFLKKYKQLEKRLKTISGLSSDTTNFRDLISISKKKNLIIKHKENQIWDLYGLRNVLAHSDRDKYIAKINSVAFNILDEIIDNIDNPPSARDVFCCEVYCASIDNSIDDVLLKMKNRLFTHIPVYDGKRFLGILSETTLLYWLVDNQNNIQLLKKKVDSINPRYFNLSENQYKFVSPNTSIFEIFNMFENSISKNERLGSVLISKSGTRNGQLLGIVTAWDMPKIRNYFK